MSQSLMPHLLTNHARTHAYSHSFRCVCVYNGNSFVFRRELVCFRESFLVYIICTQIFICVAAFVLATILKTMNLNCDILSNKLNKKNSIFFGEGTLISCALVLALPWRAKTKQNNTKWFIKINTLANHRQKFQYIAANHWKCLCRVHSLVIVIEIESTFTCCAAKKNGMLNGTCRCLPLRRRP